jgi:hypothetical protein
MFESMFIYKYLFCLLCISIGYVSVTPIFEGFDEGAHLSLIHEIRALNLPEYGVSSIDRVIHEYKGPKSYTSGSGPFDKSEYSYNKFYSSDERIEYYKLNYKNNKFKLDFDPVGKELSSNWQAQHPPLYYGVMALFSNLFNENNVVFYIFWMRMISVLLFLTGVLVALKKLLEKNLLDCKLKVGLLSFPIFIPMIFPEVSRIGNDSLCIFFTGLISYKLITFYYNEDNYNDSLILGILLGLGLLTKAIFIPIAIGINIIILLRTYNNKLLKKGFIKIFIITFTFCFISGWWYFMKYRLTGSFTGADELIELDKAGGLLQGLIKNFTIYEYLRGSIVTVVSFIWAGTGSLVRPKFYLLLPLVLFNLVLFFYYLKFLIKSRSITDYDYSGLIFLAIFYFCLHIHTINVLALYGRGTTPGWYMCILYPWLIIGYSRGIDEFVKSISKGKKFFIYIFYFGLIFSIVVIASQCLIFAGIASKSINKYIDYSMLNLNSLNLIPERMSSLMPFNFYYSILFFVLGYSLLCIIFNREMNNYAS